MKSEYEFEHEYSEPIFELLGREEVETVQEASDHINENIKYIELLEASHELKSRDYLVSDESSSNTI